LKHLALPSLVLMVAIIIFIHPNIPELVNLQNAKGKAKPYQIRQFLTIVEQYNLSLED
jgi:hypothetical protein